MSSKLETLIHAPTLKLRNWLRRWETQIASALLQGKYQITPEGVILFEDHVLRGEYFHRVREREKDYTFSRNLIVDQGVMKALGVMFFTDAKIATWYLTLFSGSTTPGATVTAANMASVLGEITSTTEGFSNATRPAFVTAAPAANIISNVASQAAFNIVATTSITATGGALISDSARGGASGFLWSAGLFTPAPRVLYTGETFDLGYQTSLVG